LEVLPIQTESQSSLVSSLTSGREPTPAQTRFSEVLERALGSPLAANSDDRNGEAVADFPAIRSSEPDPRTSYMAPGSWSLEDGPGPSTPLYLAATSSEASINTNSLNGAPITAQTNSSDTGRGAPVPTFAEQQSIAQSQDAARSQGDKGQNGAAGSSPASGKAAPGTPENSVASDHADSAKSRRSAGDGTKRAADGSGENGDAKSRGSADSSNMKPAASGAKNADTPRSKTAAEKLASDAQTQTVLVPGWSAAANKALEKRISEGDEKAVQQLLRALAQERASAETTELTKKVAPGKDDDSAKSKTKTGDLGQATGVAQILVHLQGDANTSNLVHAEGAAGAQGQGGGAQGPGNGQVQAVQAAQHETTASMTVIDLRHGAESRTGGGTDGHSGTQGNNANASQPAPSGNADASTVRVFHLTPEPGASPPAARVAAGASGGRGDAAGSLDQNFPTIAQQVVKQSGILLRDNNSGEIRLVLKPESLGNVRIRIDLNDNNLTGQIFVQNNQVAKIIQQNLSSLYQAFRDSGFNTAAFNVNVGGRDSAERERGKHTPLPSLYGIAAVGNLSAGVPSADSRADFYSLVNLIV
jgi:flagellar hook-length control protein FliK